MWQCRKIYANLLMLSVLFFALGASVTPRINCGAADQAVWNKKPENVEFRWECGSGQIVYRGQQITAVTENELDFVLPEKLDAIFRVGVFAENMPENLTAYCMELLAVSCSRAAPEFALSGEQIV
jgi:hypothetical protein